MLQKAIIVVLILGMSLSVSAQEWFSNGILTNPAANAILAETGTYNNWLLWQCA